MPREEQIQKLTDKTMKEKDVIFKCYNVGCSVGELSAQFINAKDIIEIVPTKIGGESELKIAYYDHKLRSECTFFCNGIVKLSL